MTPNSTRMPAQTQAFTPEPEVSPGEDRAALDRLRPALLAIPASEVTTLRASVHQAVRNVLQVARSYPEDRALLAAAFRPAAFDPAELDDLELRARALRQAQNDLRLAEDPGTEWDALIAAAVPLRRKLLRTATFLWEDDDRLGVLRGGRSHAEVADDLGVLQSLFRERWDEVADSVPLGVADLDEAERLCHELQARRGPGSTPEEVAALRDLRDRAGRYAWEALDVIRLAVAFAKRGAADPLAGYPSLYTRPGRTRSGEEAGEEAGDAGLDGEPPEGDDAVAAPEAPRADGAADGAAAA